MAANNIVTMKLKGGTVKARASLGQTVVQYIGEANPYTGAYDVVPGDEEQVLRTRGKYMTDDVTVQKIPSNYGKIGWDGIKLTVS